MGHVIKELTINSNQDYVGLFGYTLGAKIENLTIQRPM